MRTSSTISSIFIYYEKNDPRAHNSIKALAGAPIDFSVVTFQTIRKTNARGKNYIAGDYVNIYWDTISK